MKKGEKFRVPEEWTEMHIKKSTRNEVDQFRAKNNLKTYQEAVELLLKKSKENGKQKKHL